MRHAILTGCAALFAACNVPEPPGSTGGIDPDAGPAVDGGARCGRGIVVVAQSPDYGSTNVSVLGLDGTVLTASLVSSSTETMGGDIVVPTLPVAGPEAILVDRGSPLAVPRLLWIDLAKARTARDLDVSTGFWSNPRDYAQVAPGKAYVTRFHENATPGGMPFDAGSDLLVVDTHAPAITAAVDLRPAMGDEYPETLPRPDKIVTVPGRAFVLLGALDAGFFPTAPARIATLDTTTDEVTGVLVLPDLRGCVGLALSPGATELAVFCSGDLRAEGDARLTGSGVGLVDIRGEASVTRVIPTREFAPEPLGFDGEYAADHVLVLQTFGHDDLGAGAVEDTIVVLDTRTLDHGVVLSSDGERWTLGDIACDAACAVCFVADAKRGGGVVHRFRVDSSGHLVDGSTVRADTQTGLPPRYLGKL